MDQTPRRIEVLTMSLLLLSTVQADDAGSPPKNAGDYRAVDCWNLTAVTDRMMHDFFSPRYPMNYPNGTECIQTIKETLKCYQKIAQRDLVIRIDFRGDFDIEHSDDCSYDYLEFRDGPWGFSPLLGRYCGRHHPPTIVSSGPWMWIAFKSDDSVEYSGFHAVYELIDPAEESSPVKTSLRRIVDDHKQLMCSEEINAERDQQGQLSDADLISPFVEVWNRTARQPINCVWTLLSPMSYRFYIRWTSYKMPNPFSCDESYIEIYERTTQADDRRRKYCGAIARELQTTSNRIYIRLFATSVDRLPTFGISYTIFLNGPCDSDWQFSCGDNTCINRSLVCNEQVNCNHSWDEIHCKPTTTTTVAMVLQSNRYYALAVPSVTGVILALAVLAVVAACRQYCQERRRRRLAIKQQQHLLLMKVDVDEGQETGTSALNVDHRSSSPVAALLAMTAPRLDVGVSAPWTDKPTCGVALSGAADDTNTLTAGVAGKSKRHSLADCTVDVVTRRAACQPLPEPPPFTSDRWRSSGRPPRTSTPRSLRRATTEATLWTLSLNSASTLAALPLSNSNNDEDDTTRWWKRSRDSRDARQLSTSVPLLGTSFSGSVTPSRRSARHHVSNGNETASNLVFTESRKFFGQRRPSLDHLRPITVDGVTTFPVCPRAIVLSSMDRKQHQLGALTVADEQEYLEQRRHNFRFTRSHRSDDDCFDENFAAIGDIRVNRMFV